MAIDYILLGKRIKEKRKNAHMTQAQLAERVDITVPYISRIETGQNHISLELLVNIADALKVSVDNLLSGNRPNLTLEYYDDFILIMKNCNSAEKTMIIEITKLIKQIIKNNK